MLEPRKILVVRRDNIGDLVCTTPLLRALRLRFPAARIDVLVNSYCAPVLEGNPNVDRLWQYTKAHHREAGESWLAVHARRLTEVVRLRRERYDLAVLAKPECLPRPLQWARLAGARHVLGFVDPGNPLGRHIDVQVPLDPSIEEHVVAASHRLLRPLGIAGEPGPLEIHPRADRAGEVRSALAERGMDGCAPLVGLHISARKERQRWPAESFAELAHRIRARFPEAGFVLLWSPGDEANPRHPGDDAKARDVQRAAEGLPLLAWPTETLDRLIAGLSVLDCLVCSDGGAMHIAAALAKPIVCFFGNSSAAVWHPWGVPHELLQPASRTVEDIAPAAAEQAFARLLERRT